MKKTTILKTSSILVQATPPILVTLLNFDVFVENTGKSIALGGVLLALILSLIFKDAFKKFITTPSALKVSLILFIISFIAVTIGHQVLMISGAAIAGGVGGTLLDSINNNIKKPDKTDDLIKAIEGLVNNNEKE